MEFHKRVYQQLWNRKNSELVSISTIKRHFPHIIIKVLHASSTIALWHIKMMKKIKDYIKLSEV